MQENKKES